MCYIFDKNQREIDSKNSEVIRIEVARRQRIKWKQLCRCVYCHDSDPEFSCYCHAYYHLECWNELNKCATLGCLGKETLKAEIEKAAYLSSRGCNPDPLTNWLKAERKILGLDPL